MPEQLLYASSNGDKWFAMQDGETGPVRVKHVPNAKSGGQISEIDATTFLAQGGGQGPEHAALLRLLGKTPEEAS